MAARMPCSDSCAGSDCFHPVPLQLTCYGVPCDTTLAMAACMPTASLDMPAYVNYKQVLGTLTYSRPFMVRHRLRVVTLPAFT